MRPSVSRLDRPLIRKFEILFALSTLLLVAVLLVPGIDRSVGTGTQWLLVGILAGLSLAVIGGSSIDAGRTVRRRSNRHGDASRRMTVKRLALVPVLLGLAGLTLWWIGGTAYVLLFGSRGGVLFGPLLALVTGGVLSVIVLGRAAVSQTTTGT